MSSYPFQPHDLLLLFNWAAILSFVGIAMWVFIQMNRDPVLSSLNGTKPGQLSWDRDFIFRILIYGIVPDPGPARRSIPAVRGTDCVSFHS